MVTVAKTVSREVAPCGMGAGVLTQPPLSALSEGENVGRIRTIKPEFPQSESVGRLTRDARLLFIQLWTQADDSGRLRGASRMLASLLYPYDEDAAGLMEGWLAELELHGHVRRYVVDGNSYIEIIKFLNHQKIDKPTASKLPPFENPRDLSANPRENFPRIKEGIKEGDQGPSNGNGANPRDGGISPEMLARGLAENLGLSLGYGPASFNTAVTEVARTEQKAGRNIEDLAVEMEAAYRFFEQEKPNLRIQWGPAKFFGDGHWRNPDGWPRKAKTRTQEIEEWSAPDDKDAA